MIFEGISIGFLWEDINEKILDGPNPFDEKWRDEKIKYRNFNKTASLEKVLKLLIIAYKDKSPRNMFYIGKNGDALYEENKSIELKEHLSRTDIEKLTETKDNSELQLTIERFFEFVGNHDFIHMVENTLQGKNFTKTKEAGKTIFKINESPIESIELTPKSFKLKLNEQIYKFLY